jgi:hypothetical protein
LPTNFVQKPWKSNWLKSLGNSPSYQMLKNKHEQDPV